MKPALRIACLILVFFMGFSCVYREANSPEQHVKEFYQLYIRCGSDLSIYSDLSKYVDSCTLSTIRILNNRDYFQSEYFTKAQDCWDEWTDAVEVHKGMKINDNTSVIPVSLKFPGHGQFHLVVFVRKRMDGWRIIKVTSAEDFYE